MFNGIIYNTGKIKYLKKGVNSTYMASNQILILKKTSDRPYVAMSCLTITKINKDIIFLCLK